MSEPLTDPAPDPTPPDPAVADDDTDLATRVTALETRVTALEDNAAPKAGTSIVHVGADGGPDWEARQSELVAQGMTEQDANEQAAYEERLWNDRNRR
jgi:hypothetical protein